MALSVKEFQTFKKFMMLTTSSNDAEALAALRRANTVIAKAGVTWDQVLSRVVKIDVPFESASDEDASEVIEALFDEALQNAHGTFRNTIEDIYNKWQKYGYLTPRQRDLIEKTARGQRNR